jgi:hypothetical protein
VIPGHVDIDALVEQAVKADDTPPAIGAVLKLLGGLCDDMRRIADASEDVANTLHEYLGDGMGRK